MIKTEDVKINTMQVEIRSMLVGKKQLTLSLMRQFIEEDIVNRDDLSLKGIPWGHINYFWGDDKGKTYPSYIHVIWQKDIYLRRCIVPMFLDKRTNFHNIKWANELIEELKVQMSGPNDMGTFSYRRIYNETDRNKKIISLQEDLKEAQKCIEDTDYYNETHIPNYLKLIEPFKALEHFYIAV